MLKLLHIIATPRGEESRTLRVSEAFLEVFRSRHPDWVVETLNLFTEELPDLTARRVDGKYVLLAGKPLFGALKETWEEIVAEIDRFRSADGYLVSTPMWNFSIPYVLKQYIDVIVQPRFLFQYTAEGRVEGLIKGKKMVVITSRGGEYVRADDRPMDFQEPYLRLIFGFVGIEDLAFVKAEPMDVNEPLREERVSAAQEAARAVAADW